MVMLLGYNTNGFAHHRLEDALTILADLGYQSVALTVDYNALNPYEPNLQARCASIRGHLERLNLQCVIETGARFLLDPRRKHQPTLISAEPSERECRFDFLHRCMGIAASINAQVVSFWSGAPVDNASNSILMDRLVENCKRLSDLANKYGLVLAFEPEPGMFIDTMNRFAELRQRLGDWFIGLTLDIGHLHCQGEVPIEDHIRRWAEPRIPWPAGQSSPSEPTNVHIEDMRRGVHDHLMFGEGEIDFVPVMKALEEIGYKDGVHVELSRHSHDAVETARKAIAFLRLVLRS
jgi:L-ribulose-5-phosphate 3-epimerase